MSRSVVVDASVVLKWLVTEEWTDVASRLLADWTAQDANIMAPSLLTSEIANALYKLLRRGELLPDDAMASMTDFLSIDIEYVALPALSARALELAYTHHLKAVYDAHYLVLAEREGL
ncbi:MAG: type II toxin-antitoxin system VapC family toxin [Ktedonobacterales bacterium]